ncbi:uncharacterized membrane protein YheB (UPF0754 family) [Thermosipho japonicus]|uniref:Uncharacterized membrane protein YheB (UPF0754 family) n=1 Tax=Thermosipho japonicus TaxID=90323 RepID=A0A841GNE6_9BACT|nr:DUF445 family protein [Thermosipho japonicus]MBB6062684.1 uncharacterized membrane protein YheB (UPF0754 family) [Thermosipho japonicus]
MIKKLAKDILFWILLLTYIVSYNIYTNFNIPAFKIIGLLSIGGLVGYITNILAIWMLFNPKRKVFGFQGVIPKKRDEIANSTSKIIEEEFINPKSLREFIEKNKENFVNSIIEFLNSKELVIPPLKNITNDRELEKKITKFIFEKIDEEKIWNLIKEKSLSELNIDISEVLINNINNFLDDSSKEKVKEFLISKIKIPIIPIGSFVEPLIDKFFDDVKNDIQQKGKIYNNLKKTIEQKIINRKIEDLLTFEQFKSLITNLKTNIFDVTIKEISILLERKIDIKKLLNYLGLDIEKLLIDIFTKYENRIISLIEKFFEKISFKEIIKEKIESYSLEEMEEVTLKLAKRELRYVEIFGIPLGMLISIFQIIF